MKNKYFGTDGIRGTVNQGNITGEKFFKLVWLLVHILRIKKNLNKLQS